MQSYKYREKKLYNKRWIGILVLFIFFLFFVLSILYIYFIKRFTYQNIYHSISEMSEQTATQLNISITNQMKFLDIMVDFINGGYVETVDQVFDRFRLDLPAYHFTRLVILDEHGNGVTSDGFSVENYPNIEEFFVQDTVYLSENRPSTVSSDQVNIYSKTFEFQGKRLVLFATILTENYQDILSRRLFNGQGGTYLINSDGSILIDSFDSITKNDISLYDHLKEERKLKRKEDIHKMNVMSKNIKSQQNGTFDIILDKKLHFIHYENIGINDWYVVSIVPDNIIAKDLTLFLGLSLVFCFIINSVIVGIFIFIYFFNRKQSQKLYITAYIDPITGLGNEVYFKENSSFFLEKFEKGNYIIIVDINKFKLFNRLYSYDFCNNILKCLGQTMVFLLKEKGIVSRASRDIFMLAFHYDGNIQTFIDQLFEEASHLRVDEKVIHLNLSVGVYPVQTKDKDINKVLDKAYMAHSKIKGAYNDRYYIFDDRLERQMLDEQKIEASMEDALANGEFKVFYQPKISVNNEQLVGAEALVRWYQNGHVISPEQFIPLFEQNKFILKLDLYVFEEVCKNMKEWEEKYQYIPSISVNVSKEHFVSADFILEYVKLTDQYHIRRDLIELEITESAAIDENIDMLQRIKDIKKYGFHVSIDDFGTGYSSLSMLENMPVDIIKIDKKFIDHANLSVDHNMINHIVYIVKNLHKKTVIEGVETNEQVQFIKKMKSDIIQGYYYSKPISKDAFEDYFKNYK